MDLYWIHVHPALPIVHKQSFIECLQRRYTFLIVNFYFI